MKEYSMKPSYTNREDYAADLFKLVQIEAFVEGLKERQFIKAKKFRFDPHEQKTITRRLLLDLPKQMNLNEQSILAIRIPYKLKDGE